MRISAKLSSFLVLKICNGKFLKVYIQILLLLFWKWIVNWLVKNFTDTFLEISLKSIDLELREPALLDTDHINFSPGFNCATILRNSSEWLFSIDVNSSKKTIPKNTQNLGFYLVSILLFRDFPGEIYLFNVNNRNTRTMCEICSKLKTKTPKRRQLHFI